MRRLSALGLAAIVAAGTLAAITTSAAHADFPANYQSTYKNNNRDCVGGATKRITGVIKGFDGQAVNAFIGLDLNTTIGGKRVQIDGGGCSDSSRHAGYGVTLAINATRVDGNGADPNTAGVITSWFADVPTNTTTVFFEASPKRPGTNSGRPQDQISDQSYYANSMRPNIPAGSYVTNIVMPLVPCGTQSVGSVTGYFYKNNKIVNGTYVSAFSETEKSDTPAGHGPFGYNRWTNSAGYRGFTIPLLASGTGSAGQAYTLIARLSDGTSKQFYMYNGTTRVQTVGIHPCKTVRFDLHF